MMNSPLVQVAAVGAGVETGTIGGAAACTIGGASPITMVVVGAFANRVWIADSDGACVGNGVGGFGAPTQAVAFLSTLQSVHPRLLCFPAGHLTQYGLLRLNPQK